MISQEQIDARINARKLEIEKLLAELGEKLLEGEPFEQERSQYLERETSAVASFPCHSK